MADTARRTRSLFPSRSPRAGIWAGTPTALRRHSTSSPAVVSCSATIVPHRWARGSIFVLPKDVRHDLRNTGTVPLLAIAFFSGEALTQTFDNVMRPTNSHLLTSPNVTG